MALHRFLIPVLPMIAVLCAFGLTSLLDRFEARLRTGKWIWLVTALCLGLTVFHAQRTARHALSVGSEQGVDSIGWLKMFAEQCRIAGLWLKEHAEPNASLATTAAGTIPFYSGLYTVDILGLNDTWIAHHVPPKGNRPGHTRSAPESYLASKAVDYLIYHPQFSERARQGGYRTLRRAEESIRYRWESHQVEALSPPHFGFWRKQAR